MMNGWRKDTPPAGQVVEVWYSTQSLLAYFDGARWRTVDGALLQVEYWRPRNARPAPQVRRLYPKL